MATIVQSVVEEYFGDVSSFFVDFSTNVTTGNGVIAVVSLVAAGGSRTFGASDATNGAYTENYEFEAGVGFGVSVHSLRNVTGGFVRVTLTVTGGTATGVMSIYEVSGLSNSLSPLVGFIENEGSTTSHVSSSSGISGSGFAVTTSQMGDNATITPGSGWTLEMTAFNPNSSVHQSRVGTLSSNQGPFTTDSAQISTGALVLFLDAVASPSAKLRIAPAGFA